mmetsp:Transcript_3008/g.8168  ORF Transcript_3008/g.8168 Transcript_3008/m.8168 type:complete len:253 (-) Transcript_3008:210-968(-)
MRHCAAARRTASHGGGARGAAACAQPWRQLSATWSAVSTGKDACRHLARPVAGHVSGRSPTLCDRGPALCDRSVRNIRSVRLAVMGQRRPRRDKQLVRDGAVCCSAALAAAATAVAAPQARPCWQRPLAAFQHGAVAADSHLACAVVEPVYLRHAGRSRLHSRAFAHSRAGNVRALSLCGSPPQVARRRHAGSCLVCNSRAAARAMHDVPPRFVRVCGRRRAHRPRPHSRAAMRRAAICAARADAHVRMAAP